MRKPANIKRAYFIGIGGIGMSALARWFNAIGIRVAGYDRVSTSITDQLQDEGISVQFEEDSSVIPEDFRIPDGTLVVYTPAIPAMHSGLLFFREHKFSVLKRSEALGLVIGDTKVLAVAGTHGKTTISAMLSHILKTSGIRAGAFLGGISKNTGTNFNFDPEAEIVVVEADEFDRSFLTLYPEMAVITAMDADHLDIYGNREALIESFSLFASQIRKGGILLLKKGLSVKDAAHLTVYTYSLDGDTDFCALNIQHKGFTFTFSLKTPGGFIEELHPSVYGRVNIENAVAACALAWLNGAGDAGIKGGMKGYKGVKRRFDVIIDRPDCLFIDDYAHHPEELKAFISSVREALPGKKLTGIFQPHLYTRTRDFAPEFAQSLSALDDVILLDIYPAREEPIDGVSPMIILDKLENSGKRIHCGKEQLLQMVEKMKPEVLLTMGAGDIDRLVEPLKRLLLDILP